MRKWLDRCTGIGIGRSKRCWPRLWVALPADDLEPPEDGRIVSAFHFLTRELAANETMDHWPLVPFDGARKEVPHAFNDGNGKRGFVADVMKKLAPQWASELGIKYDPNQSVNVEFCQSLARLSKSRQAPFVKRVEVKAQLLERVHR